MSASDKSTGNTYEDLRKYEAELSKVAMTDEELIIATTPKSTAIDSIEMTLELNYDYKAGEKIVLELRRFPEAKAELRTLIKMEVIGKDEYVGGLSATQFRDHKVRDELRAKQRKAANKLFGGDSL